MKLLLTGDLHFRLDKPKCWKGDYQQALFRKWSNLLLSYQEYLYDRWLDAGDFFHRARPGFITINRIISFLLDDKNYGSLKKNRRVYCVAGNHDMPNHNKDYLGDSALGTLLSCKLFELLGSYPIIMAGGHHVYGASYGEPIPDVLEKEAFNILVAHTMIYGTSKEAKLAKFGEGMSAREFMQKYPYYDLIVTGHNHKRIIVGMGNRCLINPGCLIRQSITEYEYQPKIVMFDTHSLTCSLKDVAIEKEDIDPNYLGDETDYQDELASFVSNLEAQEEFAISFHRNIKEVLEEQRANRNIRKLVEGLINESNK